MKNKGCRVKDVSFRTAVFLFCNLYYVFDFTIELQTDFFDDLHALSGQIGLEGLVHAFAEKPGKIAWVIAGQICKILQ